MKLTVRIVMFAVTIGWAIKVRRLPPDAVAARVRAFFEDLSGLWIKAGQILSLRTDLLTREMADQLSELQYRAFGFAPEIATGIIERSLGGPIGEVFDGVVARFVITRSVFDGRRSLPLVSGRNDDDRNRYDAGRPLCSLERPSHRCVGVFGNAVAPPCGARRSCWMATTTT